MKKEKPLRTLKDIFPEDFKDIIYWDTTEKGELKNMRYILTKREIDILIDFRKKLKTEAIKWVKDEDKLSPSAKAGFIEFHNITKEDLK